MRNIKFSILFTTAFLLINAFLPPMGVSFFIVFLFFILMHVFYFWMIYMILKFGEGSGRTFSEHWYDDLNIPKNNLD